MSSGHWLTRPQTIRRLWFGGSALLAGTVAAQLLAHVHPHFVFEGWFAFHALFGFLSCVAIVLLTKVLGGVLKRRDSYYDD